jgi:hypothetical protein
MAYVVQSILRLCKNDFNVVLLNLHARNVKMGVNRAQSWVVGRIRVYPYPGAGHQPCC